MDSWGSWASLKPHIHTHAQMYTCPINSTMRILLQRLPCVDSLHCLYVYVCVIKTHWAHGFGKYLHVCIRGEFLLWPNIQETKKSPETHKPLPLTTSIKTFPSENKHVSTLKGRFRISGIMDEFITTNSTTWCLCSYRTELWDFLWHNSCVCRQRQGQMYGGEFQHHHTHIDKHTRSWVHSHTAH